MTAAELPYLDVETSMVGRVGHATVMGEIDAHTAPRLLDPLEGLVEDGALELVVDLSAVTFMDSSGLGILIRMQRLTPTHNLKITGASDTTRRVLRATGLDKLFDVEPLDEES